MLTRLGIFHPHFPNQASTNSSKNKSQFCPALSSIVNSTEDSVQPNSQAVSLLRDLQVDLRKNRVSTGKARDQDKNEARTIGMAVSPFAVVCWWHFTDPRRWKKNPKPFWDSVKPSALGRDRPQWMTFDDEWVDEVSRGLKACKVFLWYPLYCTLVSLTRQSRRSSPTLI